jgi:hypothetical protein
MRTFLPPRGASDGAAAAAAMTPTALAPSTGAAGAVGVARAVAIGTKHRHRSLVNSVDVDDRVGIKYAPMLLCDPGRAAVSSALNAAAAPALHIETDKNEGAKQ